VDTFIPGSLYRLLYTDVLLINITFNLHHVSALRLDLTPQAVNRAMYDVIGLLAPTKFAVLFVSVINGLNVSKPQNH
jgi:hypothetical protein